MIPLLEEKMKLKKELYKEHVTSPDINEKDVKEDEILFEIYLKLEQPDENVIICPVCGLQVKSKRALSFHKYNVHQVKPSNCNVCGKSCPNQRRLNQHIRYHEKKTCEICQKDISVDYIKKIEDSFVWSRTTRKVPVFSLPISFNLKIRCSKSLQDSCYWYCCWTRSDV